MTTLVSNGFTASRAGPRSLARALHQRRRSAAVLAVILLALALHGYNMLHYPYLEDDEGTYFSQAWAVFHLGRLAPYTYFYDHAPLGWIQIAIWQLITGGHRFGYALASGRILMLLFQLGSASLVVAIGRRATGKLWVGLLAALLFSVSPYGISYHRRILLDNIAGFWLLFSLYQLSGTMTLRRVWLSGVAIGVAALSKEIAVAAIPALAVLVARRSPPENRVFAVPGWLGLALSICVTYPLMALLKSELFPTGTPLGGHSPHVSLICSLSWQASRGSDGGLLDPTSGFWVEASSWAHVEPLLVLAGTAAALVAAIALRRDAFASMLGWTILSLWLFLARGGVVLTIYLVPLLPLLALAIAMVLNRTLGLIRRRLRPTLASPAVALTIALTLTGSAAAVGLAYERAGTGLWTADPADGQVRATNWIERHLPHSSRLVMDNYLWNDLHDPAHGSPFTAAVYYWKAADDPQVRRDVFANDWHRVDYVISTPQLVYDTGQQGFPLVTPALEHSRLIRTFDTGGWGVEVRRVDPAAKTLYAVPHRATQRATGCMNNTG